MRGDELRKKTAAMARKAVMAIAAPLDDAQKKRWREVLIRTLIPIGCVEGVRMPLMMASISDADMTRSQIALFVVAACICGCIPVLLTLRARGENGFTTVWDLAIRHTLIRHTLIRHALIRHARTPAPGAS